ncbi:MAG TPA: RICIN domain-containing protein [Micromonosporaceae bacterium]|nr:RICIN domain-containing protein [Micromonosporaceae bacterium]
MFARKEQRSSGKLSRRRLVGAIAAVILLPAIAAPTILNVVATADADIAPITQTPPDRVDLGLRYAGLTPAKKGEPCVGGYRADDSTTCTHGPDAPPPGLDIKRDIAPVAPAVAEPIAPQRETAAGPTESDVAQDAGGSVDTDSAPALLADAAPDTAGYTMAPSGVACEGDGVSGKRVQVLYVRGASTASRFGTYLNSFRTWAAGVDTIYDASAQETGGSRHIRFVTTPDCNVDVREVEVSATAIATFSATISALRALGYNRTDRKYMIFADSKVYCGIGSFPGDQKIAASNRSNSGPAYGRSDSGCWSPSVAAHELGHNLGAVNDSAPNSNKAGHCVDEYDVMCYNDPNGAKTRVVCTARTHDQRLDCNHDDYYHTNPKPGSYLATHWNMANSDFLIRGPNAGGGTTSPAPTTAAATPTRTPPTSPRATRPAGGPPTAQSGGTASPGPSSSTSPSTGPAATPSPTRSRDIAPTSSPSPSRGVDPTVSPGPGTSTPGGTPRALRISDAGTTSVRLTWDAAAAGTRYAVLLNGRSLGSVRSTSVRVTGLRPDTEYRFAVSTVQADRSLVPHTAEATVRTRSVATVPGTDRVVAVSNVMTGGVAEVFGARAADGTPVVLSRRNDASPQRWKLVPAGDGYLMRSEATGKCLAPLTGAAPAAGTPLVQYACAAGHATQVWRLVATPFGSALTSGDGLVAAAGTQRFCTDRVLTLQRPSAARHQSWTVEAV